MKSIDKSIVKLIDEDLMSLYPRIQLSTCKSKKVYINILVLSTHYPPHF